MRADTRTPKLVAAATLAALAPLAAWPAAGEFTFVVGEVTLVKANGTRTTPTKGAAVDPGDQINTGANGMAQLTMVDQARLSLRPQTQFVIENYADRRDSAQGGVLSLLKGTLRTFTGLIASANRDKFVMKTRVATVGIRGSGNILYACEDKECDESVAGPGGAQGMLTVNHTIDGSHAISGTGSGQSTLVTGPGQTVLIGTNLAPRYIPTPRFIADVAINMTGAKESGTPPAGAAAETRDFSPSDTQALPPSLQQQQPLVGNNGLGFPTIDASANAASDPLRLEDLVYSAGSPLYGQSLPADVVRDGNGVRSYRSYPGGAVSPTIVGGTAADNGSLNSDGTLVTWGRYSGASLGFGGGGAPVSGSIHWINAGSGYPTYLSEVLTGSATYALVGGTSPTNQNNTVGTVGAASLNVNFSNRTLDLSASITMPAAGSAGSGSWSLAANNVPIALNTFYASSQDFLTITNGAGVSSRNTNDLSGSVQGAFVGNGISMAILGYGISDQTAASLANWHFVSGVALLAGPPRNPAAEYREGRVSDVDGSISQFIRTYATTNRPDEVVVNAQNGVTIFSAPYADFGPHATYAIGSSQVVDSGFDPDTGMVWGRWGGGSATVTRAGLSRELALTERSLHYIFAGTQSGPVSLPLTGTAVYDVIGATRPTDFNGHVGTMNAATLNANFNNRTVDATVNIAIAGQTWNASAAGMPIYRNQYFSAYAGTPIAGLPNPSPLVITCTPACGQGASGSFDGFFTGRTGGRAGMTYNIGNNQGAIAFGRRGG